MLDAKSDKVICGDNYARYFTNVKCMDVLERFAEFEHHKIANLFRHKIIDDMVNNELSKNMNARIILIGAGFDTRAFRFDGGTWFEIDEPEIIEYKNTRLPAFNCKNTLTRISHVFSKQQLEQTLRSCNGSSKVIIVIEGVLRYLDRGETETLILDLKKAFPMHGLICDLMSREFYEEYGCATSDVLANMGAPIKFHAIDPQQLFKDRGYRLVDTVSVIRAALESGRFTNEADLIEDRTTVLNGYSICRFEIP
jgi:O-methyltransferase involved in polyketide biosynthesis